MSFSFHVRPLPVEQPPVETFYDLKFIFARAGLLPGDGSLRCEPRTFTKPDYATISVILQGALSVLGPNDDRRESIAAFKALMEANPQGVMVWIGDQEDF